MAGGTGCLDLRLWNAVLRSVQPMEEFDVFVHSGVLVVVRLRIR